jgi:hypothetical protein
VAAGLGPLGDDQVAPGLDRQHAVDVPTGPGDL